MVLSRIWLKSKITKPTYPVTVVKRMRLYEKLAGWQEKRAILVNAPSGYGKSTLISHWIDIAGVSEQTAWLSLDESDSDPRQFISQIAAALDTVVPGMLARVQPILDDSQGDAERAVRRLLAVLEERDLSDAGQNHCVLVLDDLHRVASAAINSLLMTLLEHGPGTFHLILIGRGRIELPTARLYAHGVLTFLETNDLRFTPSDVRDYLLGVGFSTLPDTDVARLAQDAEGWIAALQLGVLSTSDRDNTSSLLASLQGSSDWVAQYLADEVLHRQNANVRRFLLETSILDAFNAQLCAAVTGRNDAKALLAEVVRADLFIVALDREHKWFRYHHLFQELLQERLRDQTEIGFVADLHRRAAAWLTQAGATFDAVKHLLTAGEIDKAGELVEERVQATILHDPYQARRLVNLLAGTAAAQRPRLLLEQCRLAALFDEKDLAQWVAEAARALAALPYDDVSFAPLQAEWLVFSAGAHHRAGEVAAMFHAMEEAQPYVHLLDDFMAGMFHFLEVHMHFAQGEDAKAGKAGERALMAFARANFGAGIVALQRELAKWAMRKGSPQEAGRRLRQVLDDHAHDGPLSTRERVMTCMAAAENSYRQDNLVDARGYQQMMHRLAKTLQDDRLICVAELLGRVYAEDKYQSEAEWQALSATSEIFVSPLPQVISIVIHRLVATGQGEKAWQIALELGLLVDTIQADMSDGVLIPHCLAYLARDIELEKLTPLLADALAHRRRNGNRFGELSILALMAWQQLRLRGRLAAIAVLIEANKLAQETGYTRVLRDIPALVPLLAEVDISESQNTLTLTDQERQVLILLDADCTYPKIAEELTISVNTVRTHVRNLYRKLSVHRRAQALEVARLQGILPSD